MKLKAQEFFEHVELLTEALEMLDAARESVDEYGNQSGLRKLMGDENSEEFLEISSKVGEAYNAVRYYLGKITDQDLMTPEDVYP